MSIWRCLHHETGDVTLLSYTVRPAGAVESAAEEASASEQAAAASSPAPPPEPQYDIVKRLRLQIGSANIPHPDKVGVVAGCHHVTLPGHTMRSDLGCRVPGRSGQASAVAAGVVWRRGCLVHQRHGRRRHWRGGWRGRLGGQRDQPRRCQLSLHLRQPILSVSGLSLMIDRIVHTTRVALHTAAQCRR
jgi:hypothetical protein